MTLFGDIKDVKNVNLTASGSGNGESVTVPEDEIWVINLSIVPYEHSSDREDYENTLGVRINGDWVLGYNSYQAERDINHGESQGYSTKIYAKGGDTIGMRIQVFDATRTGEVKGHLSIAVMEDMS